MHIAIRTWPHNNTIMYITLNQQSIKSDFELIKAAKYIYANNFVYHSKIDSNVGLIWCYNLRAMHPSQQHDIKLYA